MKFFSKIKKKLSWLKGDSDITFYDEWHYISITLFELFLIIKNRNK